MRYNFISFFINSRLYSVRNLLFFVMVLVSACKRSSKDIVVVWADNKATQIRIPFSLVDDVAEDSVSHLISVRRADKDSVNIFGDYEIKKDVVLFSPLVPFAWGTDYIVLLRNKKVAKFKVDAAYRNDRSIVITTYPQADTVPENLLKIYIQFSHPMREGESEKYIHLIKNDKDTLHDAFLNLQPELWNEDRTVLTIWLDPGRIKRGLQPNLKLGAPLHQQEKYRLLIDKDWKDVQGVPLEKSYTWNFTTTHRDSTSPDIATWNVFFMKTGNKEPLMIDFHEKLDHFLLMESLHITDKNNFPVKGSWEINDSDRICIFTPSQPWIKGDYILRIDAKLEDLSGNNLNRPFERDMLKTKEKVEKSYYERAFSY